MSPEWLFGSSNYSISEMQKCLLYKLYFPRTVILKHQCASESPGAEVKGYWGEVKEAKGGQIYDEARRLNLGR